ncbi:hypothetical protein AB0M47_38860 [Hamadaea sp. NPDC051192]|uniref:hypothetical protein n=1 Tax=Hamadaea sp. NPDC051192 TaxID=3154940 RepID=UPI003429AD06
MTSDATPADAVRMMDGWVVSWLPDRMLSRDEAITAMTVAECIAEGVAPGDRLWPHVVGWLAELSLTVSDLDGRCAICLTRLRSQLAPWAISPGTRVPHLATGEYGCPSGIAVELAAGGVR